MDLSLLRPLRFSVLLLSALGAAGTVSAHTFTSEDGRTFAGEIRAASLGSVTIRRKADGKEFKLPLTKLSAADQAEVEAWKKLQALSKLAVSASKDKLQSLRTGGAGPTAVADGKSQSWCWVITVKNASPEPVSGLKLSYSQIVERTDRNQGGVRGAAKSVARASNGVMDVPDIPAFGSVQVRTEPISVESCKSATSSTTTDRSGNRNTVVTTMKWDEALSGLRVEIKKDERSVVNWKTGTDPEAKTGPVIPGRP